MIIYNKARHTKWLNYLGSWLYFPKLKLQIKGKEQLNICVC